jgi:hypothetical protein
LLETTLDDTALVTREWQRWLAHNRMLGASEDSLVEIMVDHGMPAPAAWAELSQQEAGPALDVGRMLVRRMRKLESLLAIREQLRTLVPSGGDVTRVPSLPPDEFLAGYYAANRPVVLLDFARGWKAVTWTPESLKLALGDEPIEVMSGRERDERYEVNAERHRSTIGFGDYVDRVQAVGRSNDIYLVANNDLLGKAAAASLWDDFDPGSPPLERETAHGNTFLWFGPAGTVTPLHHDVMNVLFVQLYGRKRFTLIAPGYTPRVYNEIGVYADVDPENPDYVRHPEFRGVPTAELVLKPGDTLFLPVGWWHRVESLDVSISLSFTNFAYANQFHWQHPG